MNKIYILIIIILLKYFFRFKGVKDYFVKLMFFLNMDSVILFGEGGKDVLWNFM